MALVWAAAVMHGQVLSFQPPVIISEDGITAHTYIQPRGLAAGDFNGDGIPDLARLAMKPGYYYAPRVALGNGDGTFRDAPPLPDGQTLAFNPASDIVLADFNGDRKLDIAVNFIVGGTGSIIVYEGNGDGSFRAPILTAWTGIAKTGPLVVADANRDGKPDLFLGNALFLGNGDGTFRRGTGFDGVVRAAADFNHDGNADVVLILDSGTLAICLGRGEGTFGGDIPLPAPFAADSVAAADFDGDGLADLAVAGAPGSNGRADFTLFLGKGDGSFQGTGTLARILPGPIFAAIDMNADGKPDILAGNSVLVGHGDGTFNLPLYVAPANTVYAGQTQPLNVAAGAAADFNGDGLPDLAFGFMFPINVLPSIQAYVSVLLNATSSTGLFTPGVSSASGGEPVAVNSLVSAFGVDLAPTTETAAGNPPTTLGGIRVHVSYAVFPATAAGSGSELLASLLYVSPTQINYVLPGGFYDVPASGGFAYVAIERIGSPFVRSGVVVPLEPVAPAFFTVNTAGLAAATAVRIAADGSQTPVAVVSCADGDCSAVPIDAGAGGVYLSLYGTGFDAGAARIACSAAGYDLAVTYAGPQGQFTGLDQLNLLLPASLPATGDTAIQCLFGQNAANPVHITLAAH